LKIDYSKGGGSKNPIVDYLETYRLDSVKFLTKDVERGNGDYYINILYYYYYYYYYLLFITFIIIKKSNYL